MSVFVFWGRNANVLVLVPFRSWPSNCPVTVSSPAPSLPPPLGWGASSRRLLFFMTRMRLTDSGEECFVLLSLLFFLSFDGLGASGPRNDSSWTSSPCYGTAWCSAPTPRRGFPPPSPSSAPPSLPFFFVFVEFFLSYLFVVLSFLALCVRFCLGSLFALRVSCPFLPG